LSFVQCSFPFHVSADDEVEADSSV
jgi:hypothetical protein